MFASRRPALLALLTLCLSACGPAETLPPQVGAARIVLPPPGGAMAAGYFELRNPGRSELVLTGVSGASFASVEMHETVETDGLSRMRAIETVTLPAGETLHFEPGARHLMLMGARLADPLPADVPMQIELRSADGVRMTIETRFALERVGGAADPAADHDEHHHHHAGH